MSRDHSRRRRWRSRQGPVGCAALAGRRERSGSRSCRDGCGPPCQRDGQSAPPPAARLDLIEVNSAANVNRDNVNRVVYDLAVGGMRLTSAVGNVGGDGR
jgi:hypothetical protein